MSSPSNTSNYLQRSPNMSSTYRDSPRISSTQPVNILNSPTTNYNLTSPHQPRRKLSNVQLDKPPTHTITIASHNDVLSKAAQLLCAVLHLRDVAYIDGDKLAVDTYNDSIQALIYLGKKLHRNSHNTVQDVTHHNGDVATQTSEYWVTIANNTITNDILDRANKQLNKQTYLIGHYLTVADIALYVAVHTSVLEFGQEERKRYTNLVRWFNHIQSIPAIRDTNVLSYIHNLTPPSNIFTLGIIEPKADRNNMQKQHPYNDAKLANAISTTAAAVENSRNSNKQNNTVEQVNTADSNKKDKKDKKSKDDTTATTTIQQSSTTAATNPAIYRLDVRIGKIITCGAHPSESKMLVSSVDIGESSMRTVVSGIADYYTPEQLNNKFVVGIYNVKAGDIKGIESTGRLFVATSQDGNKKELIEPPHDVNIGEKITFQGVDKQPDATVAPKHMHEILKHFTTDNDGNVLWKNLTFNTSHGVCKAPTIKNGTVA